MRYLCPSELFVQHRPKSEGKNVKPRRKIRRNGFQVYRNEIVLATHRELSYEPNAARIKMTTGINAFLSFRNFSADFNLPVVLYFNGESLLLPIERAQNENNKIFFVQLLQAKKNFLDINLFDVECLTS